MWHSPKTWISAIVTVLDLNEQIRDNEIELRQGGLALPSQAANDFIFGSTATQLGRVAAATGKGPYFNGSAWVMDVFGGTLRARVYHSANQSIPDSTPTDLTFDTEAFDAGGLHSTTVANNRITIPADGDGMWLLLTAVEFAGNATGTRKIRIKKNGTEIIGTSSHASNTTALRLNAMTVFPAVATDFFTVDAFQDTGGALDVIPGGGGSSWFAAIRLGG